MTAVLTRTGPSRQRAYREMALAALLWGTIGPAAAFVTDHTSLSPIQTSLWRLLVAVVPLSAIALVVGRAAARPTRGLVLGALAVGAVTGMSQLAYFAAVVESGIAIPTLIACGLGPILTAVGQTVLFGDRPDARTLIALAVALGGLVLLMLDSPHTVTALGIVLSVLSAVTYAAYALSVGPVSRGMSTLNLTAIASLGGALAILPFTFADGGPGVPGTVAGWAGILHLGVIVSCVAYGLYYSSARTLPSTHITILILLEPLVAALLAVVFFGEHLTAGTIAGGVLMLAAVAALRDHDG
ncbi:DME family drug/metabolite transporter [Solirubrobacter pauli]|uniref:DME family drug/metabolite transporter n=1 Tax=Solirubrobacter pauli TaxID=166793 RepID=A0A660L0I6_9ACTN|nr:DMT family transporter [Solirubrobacter pauli]RKQ86734.1 DME family drug/metabolite transporter [Solirubrobacter pauli]